MRGEWCYWKSYFDKSFCEQVLDKGLKLPGREANMGPFGNITNKDFRTSTIRFIHEYNKEFEFLFDIVWKLAIKTNYRWFDFHLNKLESIQLAEYDSAEQGHYDKHIDTFWVNPLKSGAQRKLSAIIQLSDPNDYEGGEFVLHGAQMEKPKSEDIKQQGTILFFPSFMEHQLMPVTSGKRYSLACWFEGPSFR